MIKEEWRSIEGLKDYYKISSLGRIKSFNIGNTKKEDYLKPQLNHKGYYHIRLYRKNGIRGSFLLHRLIAKTFIKNVLSKPQVNHINGSKTNNVISNLEWMTNKENYQHSVDNNLQGQRFLNKDSILDYTHPRIKYFILDTNTGVYYYGASDFAEYKGVSNSTVLNWIKGNKLENRYIIT